MAAWRLAVVWTATCLSLARGNMLPVFINDMNNLPLSESTPVGTKVYTLEGQDPDGYPIKYGLKYTDKFTVNPTTGDVTLAKPLDRELEDTVKFEVSIEEQDPSTDQNLVQTQPVTVIVLDENDNPPTFKNSPYEVEVPEDEAVGTTILKNIEVEDRDSVGDNLEVECVPNEQFPAACEVFQVVTLQASANSYSAALVLKRPLDYNDKQFYQFRLYANDGSLNSSAGVEVAVVDVQNSPPAFSGAQSAALPEDAHLGSLVLTVRASDPDRAMPRPLLYELLTNPHDFFMLDRDSGELRTAKPLDREALEDPSSPLNLTVRATEIVDGSPLYSPLTSSVGVVTVTLRDVNDVPPTFSRREYSVALPEDLPPGTPLPNLDMIVTDADLGSNSAFSLRVSDPRFTVEPAEAAGTAAVTLRLNASLDYEDPNQRNFIIEVIAEELHTSPKLKSRASVSVLVRDVNDNSPQWGESRYSATVREDATEGELVISLPATDRDTGSFGTEGIVYSVSGNGAELFRVERSSGNISVAACDTPGLAPCLDIETRKDYFLQLKATDEYGSGQSSVVSVQIALTDANDNAPVFDTKLYKASIDEDAVKFEPELQVQARDVDVSSEIRYSIIEPESHPFWIDPVSGRITVHPDAGGVNSTDNNKILLTVQATDGVHSARCGVEVWVRDVNNHRPQFDLANYDADIAEDAPPGTVVAGVRATDLDRGSNAALRYSIQRGAYEAFTVHPDSGLVTLAAQLDYDKRNTYNILILATDSGMPSLTGTAELTVHVVDVNDKKPAFTPATQRATVSADAVPGANLHQLAATDADIADPALLQYSLDTTRDIRAVDNNGQPVSDPALQSWFSVSGNGSVYVSGALDRRRAAVLTLPVSVTDPTAPALQQASGELIITIVDVNRHAPVFSQPGYWEQLLEEQPVGTVLNTYSATDEETPIAAIVIDPPSDYFQIDNVTGVVRSTRRIDYETMQWANFTLVAYDSGVPPRSTRAGVAVAITNANDEEPQFSAPRYSAELLEHCAPGTSVLTVHAVDNDLGSFGEVSYSLSGEQAALFAIDSMSGVVTVAAGADIDREQSPRLRLRAHAADNAPPQLRKSTSVPIDITVVDINDNAPVFSQKVYKSSIAENLALSPPAAILQVRAEDKDEGLNAQLLYSIKEQSHPGVFRVDGASGIIYPALPVQAPELYTLVVSARDEAGAGPHEATAQVHVRARSLNRHAPRILQPPPHVTHIDVPEDLAQADYLITTVQAVDEDSGENGRVSYFLEVDNQNVGETAEFVIDKDSGELRTKTFLDRRVKAEYQVVVCAVDGGSPAQSSLRVLRVRVTRSRRAQPGFPRPHYSFAVQENLPPRTLVGSVKAVDAEGDEEAEGEGQGAVYYHLVAASAPGAFTLNKKSGLIHTNASFDREQQSEYSFVVYASNSPIVNNTAALLSGLDNRTEGPRDVTTVNVTILDENDNEPKFEEDVYYAGVVYTARPQEAVVQVRALDPDWGRNGALQYQLAASNLHKFGADTSSGSVVPSPFNVTDDGVVTTAHYMSEYNQDRFVLDVIARELAPPYREAKAQVYVWVVARSALVRLGVSRGCAAARSARLRLAQAARALLAPVNARSTAGHHHAHTHWCEVHVIAVEPDTWRVLPASRLLEAADRSYDQLQAVYRDLGVETLIAAAATDKGPESFDPALAALIALLIVLFTGIVTFIVVCACLKHWVVGGESLVSSKGDSLARRRILEELSTTENPLWLENKLRPYEEQELTMNVFGDQQDANTQPPCESDNTYATIAGRRGQYATLGGDEPSPLEAALGFQGSTFKPPTPDTPEPPPRPTGLAQL